MIKFLQFAIYNFVLLQLINGEKSGLYSRRKNRSGPHHRSNNAAFLSTGVSPRSSETVIRKRTVGTTTRHNTSLQFKIEQFPTVFGKGLKKDTSDQDGTEIDNLALPSWTVSPEIIGKQAELLIPKPIESSPEEIEEKNNNLTSEETVDVLDWDKFVLSLQTSIKELVEASAPSASFDLSASTEHILKEASQQIESILSDASKPFSTGKLDENADVFKMVQSVVEAAEIIAKEQGLDFAKQARETTDYTAKFLNAANGVLLSGYVHGGVDRGDFTKELAGEIDFPISELPEDVKPLFSAYDTARSIPKAEYHQTVEKGAEMAELAGAMYSDAKVITDKLGHAIVANGTTADVVWMVTDSVGYEEDYISPSDAVTERIPTLIRTVTIRGYDASDETVDRERLLNQLCAANPMLLGDGNKDVFFHGGLLDVAEEIYSQISPLLDLAGPTHKIVFNGHSIGGSLASLLLFLFTDHHGDSFVREKVLRTFTFGSIPIAFSAETTDTSKEITDCPILRSYGLPASMIYGYVQPWDPIVRLFSPIDALYPLVDDLGEDGVSLYASGPNRALRPIIRSILESWEGWPTLRRILLGSAIVQDYESIGIQHLLLPDRNRYITDRLLNVNIGAPPLEEVIRISSVELYSALEDIFPLDTFSISFLPTAIRSFIHHFFPAYEEGLKNYVKKETVKEKSTM